MLLDPLPQAEQPHRPRTAASPRRARQRAAAFRAAFRWRAARAPSSIVHRRDGHDAAQAQRRKSVLQHGSGRLAREALAARDRQEGIAEIDVVEPVAAHQAAHADRRAPRAVGARRTPPHRPQCKAVACLCGEEPVGDVGAGIVKRAHTAVANVAQPAGIVQQVDDEGSVVEGERLDGQPHRVQHDRSVDGCRFSRLVNRARRALPPRAGARKAALRRQTTGCAPTNDCCAGSGEARATAAASGDASLAPPPSMSRFL